MGQTLEPRALHPWHGGWCDFYFDDGVVTLKTMSNVLLRTFTDEDYAHMRALVKKGPGAYRDEELGLNHGEECYTIMVKDEPPKPGLVKSLFQKRLEELNDKYDKDLELEIPENVDEKLLHKEES